MLEHFKKDVIEGLSRNPKSLPSKYFYDEKGDELFIKIMQLPEYYLTRSELEIFQKQSDKIIQTLNIKPSSYFNLIELGAGDGSKTSELVKVLTSNKYQFDFLPIDISANALNLIEEKFRKEFPALTIKKMQGDYFKLLDSMKESRLPKVILFLGSNIGNMDDEKAADFLCELSEKLCQGDKLLLGVDLIKSASVVLPAYNDKQGITREFNLNLLRRINKELDANFNINNFEHIPEYSESEGKAKSFLESKIHQQVQIKEVNRSFAFSKGERILTEISRKYDDCIIDKIFKNSRFNKIGKISDRKGYFANYIFSRT